MFNAQPAVTAVNENPAGAVNANGVESIQATLAHVEHALERAQALSDTLAQAGATFKLNQAHCDCCGRDKAYSAMAMAGLCDVCAAELDELGEQVWETQQDALSLMHW